MTVTLKRRPAFFVINILLPVNLIAILDILVFLIPIESGERIGVSLTVLLSQTVYMSITSTYLPTASDSIPLVVFFLMIMTVMAVFTVAMCILFAWLHHKEEEESRRKEMNSVFKSTLKKLKIVSANKTAPMNPSKRIHLNSSRILNQTQKTEGYDDQIQAALFTTSQDAQQKAPFSYSLDSGLAKPEINNAYGYNQEAAQNDSFKEMASNLKNASQTLVKSNCQSLSEKGKYKMIVTFLEKTCLMAFLLVYIITLLSFTISFMT
ncbi:acetylcholine receptor subunit alpha [Plakobranchus ocellatus]|uniref:Acetylcholine receptor subunit alpha n=1 Tax=Plakobranchus ocellatus TaxID=259542 RepID=A0AAV4DX36_9GAST|nr:acetylcholine receptor subunit alpha [Plakobranchus ocellatus]